MTAPEEDQTLSTPETEPEIEPETETETPAVEDEVRRSRSSPISTRDVEIEGLDAVAPIPAVFSDRPIQTVGRRKEAIVRVRLMPGTGKFTLNGRTLEQYFPNKLHQQLIREPLVTVDKAERFDIFANLGGGGTSGQAGALRLAIARALIEVDPDDRPPLKQRRVPHA